MLDQSFLDFVNEITLSIALEEWAKLATDMSKNLGQVLLGDIYDKVDFNAEE